MQIHKKSPESGLFFITVNCINYNFATGFVNLDFKLEALLS
jgi:hypothetical protein